VSRPKEIPKGDPRRSVLQGLDLVGTIIIIIKYFLNKKLKKN